MSLLSAVAGPAVGGLLGLAGTAYSASQAGFDRDWETK